MRLELDATNAAGGVHRRPCRLGAGGVLDMAIGMLGVDADKARQAEPCRRDHGEETPSSGKGFDCGRDWIAAHRFTNTEGSSPTRRFAATSV
jgi:hypothetical protein